ncbi:MAG: HD domain-containing protein [Erysipelotrichaceae bacterium]|nr:HD domain-containing protein [Erysipelotrichaceae bacterium]
MEPKELLDILGVAHRLKINTRHCFMENNRQESVAEHSWRVSLMALLVADEFPQFDMDRVIKMCLIHDLGEAFTGDIPAFEKNDADRITEVDQFRRWIESFPNPTRQTFQSLLEEMDAQITPESKLFKALDKLEAVIAHNESDIETWLDLEYEFQYIYGAKQVTFSDYLIRLKKEIDDWTTQKIEQSKNQKEKSL